MKPIVCLLISLYILSCPYNSEAASINSFDTLMTVSPAKNNATLYHAHNEPIDSIKREKIEYRDGNYEKPYGYGHQREAIADSIYKATYSQVIREIRQQYRYKALAFLGGILLIGSVWMINRRKRVKQCADADIRRMEVSGSELQSHSNAVKIEVNTVEEKEKLTEALKVRLKGLCELVEKTRSMKSAAFAKEFQKYVRVNVRSDISLLDLQYVVNKDYHGIIDYLKAHYPRLTKPDLDLVALICFGFSQYGICYLYDMEKQTLYNKRHRLRERLELKQNQKIELFIRNLTKTLAHEQSA